MPFKISRTSIVRLRPPCLAGGIMGSTITHSAPVPTANKTASAKSTKPLATHGRTIHNGTKRRPDDVPCQLLGSEADLLRKGLIRRSLFFPSLKCDIVPSIACRRPPAGGSHGLPHPTARIHIRNGRRSSCVAARGARSILHGGREQ